MQLNTASEDRPHACRRIQLQRTDLMHAAEYSPRGQTSCSRIQLQRTHLMQWNTALEDTPRAVEYSSRGYT